MRLTSSNSVGFSKYVNAGGELGPAAGNFLRRNPFHVLVIKLPLTILVPTLRRLQGGTGTDGAFQQIQGQGHGLRLGLRIVGFAARIAQGKVAEQKTRHAALFNDIF